MFEISGNEKYNCEIQKFLNVSPEKVEFSGYKRGPIIRDQGGGGRRAGIGPTRNSIIPDSCWSRVFLVDGTLRDCLTRLRWTTTGKAGYWIGRYELDEECVSFKFFTVI
jgi:hypothetical protein